MVEPPRLPRALLRLIPQPQREFIEGDLEEEFALRVTEAGRQRAASWYWKQVLATLPPVGLDAALALLDRPLSFRGLQRRILAMVPSPGGPVPSAPPRRVAFGRRLLASKPPRDEGIFATSLVSMVFHVGIFGGLVFGSAGGGVEEPPAEIKVIEMVQPLEERKAPPPPPPTEGAVPEESTIPEFVVPAEIPIDIPPPGTGPITTLDIIRAIEMDRDSTNQKSDIVEIGERPSFTPFEVAPRLENRDDVGRALQREYPTLLRDAGIGGTVEVWIFLDDQGSVQNVQVNKTSGQPPLDDAALRVARIMEFSPAMNRDKPVPVWVKIPVTFQVL